MRKSDFKEMPGHKNHYGKSYPPNKGDFHIPQLYNEMDKIFFSDGYNLAKEHLENSLSINSMINMSSCLYEAVNGLTDSFIRRCRLEGKTIDCRKGCYLCCCQAVLVLPYEVLYIISFIKQNLSKKEQEEIISRVISKDEITKNMKVDEFLSYRDPCPLLKNGNCIIYDARPMACRTYLSASLKGCEQEYNHPKDINIFPDLYEFTIRTGRMMNEGICAYLTENQIFPTEWQMESSLRTSLEDDQAFEQWLNGENVFQKRNYSDEEISYLHRFGSRKT